MIKNKVIEVLGKHYSPKISVYLVENNFTNIYGVPYSYHSIQMVVNGTNINTEMTMAILELLEKEVKNKKKLEKKLEKIKP